MSQLQGKDNTSDIELKRNYQEALQTIIQLKQQHESTVAQLKKDEFTRMSKTIKEEISLVTEILGSDLKEYQERIRRLEEEVKERDATI